MRQSELRLKAIIVTILLIGLLGGSFAGLG